MPPTSSDVAIIGSGVAGALIAWQLVRRGYSVRIFEKGPEYPYPHASQFEAEVTHLDTPTEFRLPGDIKGHTVSGDYKRNLEIERFMYTGGSANRWEGIALRMIPEDFRTRTLFGFGADWPLRYSDLEPYYCRAEAALGVSGTDDDNPFAPRRSRPFPLAPFELAHDDVVLAERLKRDGLHLHTTPQARTRQPYDGRPMCQNFGRCPVCPIGVRYSPGLHLQRAVETGLCTITTNASVRRIDADGSRAKGVVYRINDERLDREHYAGLIVLAAGAIESIRVLLLSGNTQHPDGIGNAGCMVGKRFTYHHMWGGNIRLKEPMHRGRIGGFTGQSHQFINPETRGRHGGVKIEFSSRAPAFHREADRPWKSVEELHERLRRSMRLRLVQLHAETDPTPDKYVALSERRDRFGDPFAHVHYASSQFDADTHQYALGLLRRYAKALDAEIASTPTLNGFNSGSHHMGGCVMGSGPADSVTDRFGQVHGLANLYIAGSSLFSACCGPNNPTLTIAALALRTADKIAEDLRQS